MGVFDGIENAEHFAGGKYVQPGLHLGEIIKVKQATTRKKRPFYVVEMKVLETSNPKEHPIGTPFSWMVMLDQDAALGNIKHFVSVASDTPIKEVQASDAEDSCSEDNPLAGIKLRVMAVNIKTRADKDFTKVTFMPADMSAADAAAAHAEASAAAETAPASA
jgi:hypothetical protein